MKRHWNGNSDKPAKASAATETGAALERMGIPITADRLPALPDTEVIQTAATAFADASDETDLRGSTATSDPSNALLQAVLELVRAYGLAATVPAYRSHRRVKASPKQIENTLRLVQRCGLTPTAIAHRPDGSTVIEIGNQPAPIGRCEPEGWPI